jgi:hypothetical protein
MSPSTKRTRRSPDDIVADLQAKIDKIKAKAEQAKVKKDPALRHISGAIRAIEKATAASSDAVTREALTEVWTILTACLAMSGALPGGRKTLIPGARREKPDPGRVLAYLNEHPGSPAERIAAELGTDTDRLRPVLHQLRDDGKVRVEGKARATRYAVVE